MLTILGFDIIIFSSNFQLDVARILVCRTCMDEIVSLICHQFPFKLLVLITLAYKHFLFINTCPAARHNRGRLILHPIDLIVWEFSNAISAHLSTNLNRIPQELLHNTVMRIERWNYNMAATRRRVHIIISQLVLRIAAVSSHLFVDDNWRCNVLLM